MSFPAPQQWLFSVKTFAAAVLALLISLWIALPNPYWALATVYIASNPLSGATRSKAIFRVLGTLIGATAAVVMVPNLAGAPVLLVLAMATWSAICLYISLLDRTPRSYVFMLAGYTAALIGFPTVDVPGTVFDVALARAEEIIIGILCAAVISSVVFPRAVAPVVIQRLRAWLRDADSSARDALETKTGPETDAHRLRLAADTGEIENLASHLGYDAGGHPDLPRRIREIQPRMLMLLPVLSSIADRLRIELSLLMRLRDLAAIRADCLGVMAAIEGNSASLSKPFAYPISDRAMPTRHYDHGLALISSIVSFATITLCCFFWIVLAWPEGGAAAMMAAVAASLFAAQDNPVPSILTFAKWSIGAVILSAIYVFAILPHVHNFETLVLVLAPALLTFGLLISKPETFVVGISLAINCAAMIGLQVTFNVDAAAFLNTSMAMTIGVGQAAIMVALLRTVGAEWSIRRLAKANRATLADIANAQNSQDDARLTGVMLDRLMLLAPRAKAAGHRIPDAIGDLREGFNILDLRRARIGLSTYSRRRVDAVLMMLKRHYLSGSATPASDLLLAAVNRAISTVRDEQSASARSALLGLVGLRRSLFPDQPPPQLPHALETLEAAQ
jgi:uncharacterized membrane protein YccC